jgi:hypothetical protein
LITLERGAETIALTSLLRDACQIFAKQIGWQPAGAIDPDSQGRHSTYRPGRLVTNRDSFVFAAALELVVNSEKADSGELDLDALVAMVNFLRGGAFLIR